MRDWSFRNALMYRMMLWITDAFATDAGLPDYDLR